MRIAPIKKPVEETVLPTATHDGFIVKAVDNMQTHSSYDDIINSTYEELITKLQTAVASLGMASAPHTSAECHVCGDPWYATIDNDYDQAFDLCEYHYNQVS